jgi:hypothetical protein
LLEAKKARVRQGPHWPGAESHAGSHGWTDSSENPPTHESAMSSHSSTANPGAVGKHSRVDPGKRGNR